MGGSARRHDDQVSVEFFSGSGNLLERIATLDKNLTSQSAFDMPATQGLQALPCMPLERFVGPASAHRSVTKIANVMDMLNNVDQSDGRGVANGQLYGELQGAR